MSRKLTTEEFIDKARKVHGDFYDYSEAKYVNAHIKVKIICPEHGPFFQTPNDHLRNHGCKLCAIKHNSENLRKDLVEFTTQAQLAHQNKYDYSKVIYTGAHTKVEIICPEHGSFFQTPKNHIDGHGCPFCSNNKKLTNSIFIEKARKIHGDKYNYSLSHVENAKTKVEIICPEHGNFLQTPDAHLRGQGCPICGKIFKSDGKPTSNTQEFLYNVLSKNFLEVKQEYLDIDRYPFHCDFYIPEHDLFIELNAFWVHQPLHGWYNPKLLTHRNLKNNLEARFPKWCPMPWWTSDVIKRKTAKKNNLNYVVLWNLEDIIEWVEAGFPIRKDWK